MRACVCVRWGNGRIKGSGLGAVQNVPSFIPPLLSTIDSAGGSEVRAARLWTQNAETHHCTAKQERGKNDVCCKPMSHFSETWRGVSVFGSIFCVDA